MAANVNSMDRAFNPKCIAVVGDKGETDYLWLRAQGSFKGKLYSVQLDPREIPGIEALGVQNYTSLLDIPESVDLVVVAVPRPVAPRVLEDCIAKGVGAAHFYTSGFAETGTEEGSRLQQALVERARLAGFHIIGPNCMGIFNPSLGVRQSEEQYVDVAGPVGFISQSGAHATTFSLEAHLQGVDINKSVSFGNGIVCDSTDYLEYFAQDPGIRAIGMYLEGVRDPARFLRLLREVTSQKPVVIWKGGLTQEGGRAIASHTGSLAVPQAVWDAGLRQCGAVKVESQDELIDALKALLHLSPVRGDRVALAGGSGGQSVAITDAFSRAGLRVPTLTQESADKLATFFSLVGASCRNPIDPGSNRRHMAQIMEILEQDANIDNLVLIVAERTWRYIPQVFENVIQSFIGLRERSPKPVMAIVPCVSSPNSVQRAREMGERLRAGNVPSFPTFERGARALRNALEYYRLRDGD